MADRTFLDRFAVMEKLAGLALTVRRLERLQTAMLRGRCSEFEEAEPEVGLPGIPPCWIDDPGGELCHVCRSRVSEFRVIRPAINAARRRLRYAADRIITKEKET